MNQQRLAFLDWMKCLGMGLIVFGHTGSGLMTMTAPFYPKQLGVVFFVFAIGFTLARDRRPIGRVLYNRLFEVYLFGGLFAVGLSVCQWFRIGDLNESNYLPLALGVNVLFNNFPANPTTWYIGSYLHLLLIGLLLSRSIRVRPWMLVVSLAVEIVCRTLLIPTAGPFVAYMLFSNWITALLLGIWAGQQDEMSAVGRLPEVFSVSACGALVVAWPLTVSALAWNNGFPFRQLTSATPGISVLAASTCISILYTTYAWLCFVVTRRLPDVAPVRFLARNTLIVFIAHMPAIYALTPIIYQHISPGLVRVAVNQGIFFVGLAFFSEVVRRLVRPTLLRQALANRFGFGGKPVAVSSTVEPT